MNRCKHQYVKATIMCAQSHAKRTAFRKPHMNLNPVFAQRTVRIRDLEAWSPWPSAMATAATQNDHSTLDSILTTATALWSSRVEWESVPKSTIEADSQSARQQLESKLQNKRERERERERFAPCKYEWSGPGLLMSPESRIDMRNLLFSTHLPLVPMAGVDGIQCRSEVAEM